MSINTKKYTYGEELANAISHLIGTVFGAAALIIMLIYSIKHGGEWHIISSIIFGLSMIILYLASTLTHWLPVGRAKELFFKFDQIAIYLLIAGSYTPFALIALRGTTGWLIFGIEWGLAITGILIKAIKPAKLEKGVNIFFILSYIIMGWIIMINIPLAIERLTLNGFLLVVVGGLFYTFGTIFFRMHKIRYHHLVWHIFVLAGTAFHVWAVYFYVLPMVV